MKLAVLRFFIDGPSEMEDSQHFVKQYIVFVVSLPAYLDGICHDYFCKKVFLDISLLVYSVCHHLSSLRSVGAFTFVFRAKHIQLNKKVCCFLGLYRVSHLARGFTGKAKIGRVTFCLIRIIVIPLVVHYYTFREYREEQPSKAIQYTLSSETFDTRLFKIVRIREHHTSKAPQ